MRQLLNPYLNNFKLLKLLFLISCVGTSCYSYNPLYNQPSKSSLTPKLGNYRVSFESEVDLELQYLKEDLENSLKTEVIVELDNKPRKIEETFTSIDSEDLDKIDSHPLSLSIEPEEEADVTEELSTSLFRSLCPVTSQPDWATIYIRYKGNKINHKSLLKYLLSYRNHQGFHEECVERIFSDILQRIRIDELFVRANFLRRGGIEINPVRVTPGNSPEIIREIRQ